MFVVVRIMHILNAFRGFWWCINMVSSHGLVMDESIEGGGDSMKYKSPYMNYDHFNAR